jgi:hypothetical protein
MFVRVKAISSERTITARVQLVEKSLAVGLKGLDAKTN